MPLQLPSFNSCLALAPAIKNGSKDAMGTNNKNNRVKKLLTGYRPVVYARQGPMFGMRQPMDGPVFQKLEDAEEWCIDIMIEHYDRRLGLSDARIEPFKGLVDCGGTPSDPAQLRDIERICEEVRSEKR